MERLRGEFGFVCMKNGGHGRPQAEGIPVTVIGEDFFDRDGMFAQRFDATPGATYLVRPDQHLCARWRQFDAVAVARAHRRALQG